MHVTCSDITPRIINNGLVGFEPPSSYFESATLSEALQKSITQSGLFASTPAPDTAAAAPDFTLEVSFTRLFVDLVGSYNVDLTSTWCLYSGSKANVIMEETISGHGAITWPPMNAGHQRAFEIAFRDLVDWGVVEMASRLQPQASNPGSLRSGSDSNQQLLLREFDRNWPKVQIGMSGAEVFALIPELPFFEISGLGSNPGDRPYTITTRPRYRFSKQKGSVSNPGDKQYTGRGYLLWFRNGFLMVKRDDYREE